LTRLIVDYERDEGPPASDGRLDGSAFHRNHAPILAVVRDVLADMDGDVLEIGSGTGQHAVAFAREFPDLIWWPTDPNPRHRRSIDAWRAASGLPNIMPAIDLDASADDWRPDHPELPRVLTAMLCINVLHISPWAVTQQLMHAAGAMLRTDGVVLIYGPFARDGDFMSPGNVAFDAALRANDPAWGVRDVTEVEKVARGEGLVLEKVAAMPANNVSLVFRR
jgi:SAM-dependent methyltransferase